MNKDDEVLECACGTGSISKYIAQRCKYLVASDFSRGMLKEAKRKLDGYKNVRVEYADIMKLSYPNETFDKVVAGNVIHLLDNLNSALKELMRVCKKGGTVIISTYINAQNGKQSLISKLLEKTGANFKRQFDLDTYKEFFKDNGYEDVSFDVVLGKMPCTITIIKKKWLNGLSNLKELYPF